MKGANLETRTSQSMNVKDLFERMNEETRERQKDKQSSPKSQKSREEAIW